MVRVFSRVLPMLACCSAYAQTSTADAPAEQASSVTVVIFIILFVGSCVAFAGYTWWRARKQGHEEAADNDTSGDVG
jgi:flagellar basal body-associated protein FliL